MTKRIEHVANNKFVSCSRVLCILCVIFRILMDKFNDYESRKTQLLHRTQPPASQEDLDEVEEMVTSLEKKEAEKCQDIIAKLSKIFTN